MEEIETEKHIIKVEVEELKKKISCSVEERVEEKKKKKKKKEAAKVNIAEELAKNTTLTSLVVEL